MKITTAFILCAGLGRRVLPLTNDTPKPLLKIKGVCLLENTINFLIKLKIEKIYINTFYLAEKISDFVENLSLPVEIKIINDGPEILDTGGGILNLINHTDENHILTLNPDTIWSEFYTETINQMEKCYFEKKAQNMLLVVKKQKSFDIKLSGDFNIEKNLLFKDEVNDFIFTGCQILDKNLFKNIKEKKFSISKIWNNLIEKKQLYGFECNNDFQHVTDIEIYNKLNC